MRTRSIVALTAIASIVAVTPAAIATEHAISASAPSVTVVPGQNSSNGNNPFFGSQNTPSNNGQSNNGQSNNGNSGWPSPSATPTPDSGNSTGTSTTAQTRGVVMVDTVVPGGEGAGTGMVLTSDGTVLTNYHVVDGSTQIRVTVPGGKSYTAKVIGHDQTHDIAVLKLVDASNLATVKLDKDGTAVGDSVLAVGQGNGQGVLYSASGKITALNQQITAQDSSSLSASENLTGLIQTDAAIVPGYSGGPLFDAHGEVIGIDTAASSTNSSMNFGGSSSQGSQGFAIPINSAMSVANSILAGTKTSTNHIGAKAALGIQVLPSGDSRGGSDGGVTVQGVVTGNAADKAGIQAGDVITNIGSATISNTTDLAKVMDGYYPGQKVSVTWTDSSGASHTATLTLQTSTTN